jgi:hypothetical protein
MEIKGRGQGIFDVLLKVDRATIPDFPELCAGSPSLTTDLATTFTISVSGHPPLLVSTVQTWRCLDLIGENPRSLRLP